MDRDLTPTQLRRDRRRLAVRVAVPVVLVGVGLAWLPGWLRPTLASSQIRTAVVTRGALDAGLTAAGLVMPAVERVLSSPLDARILHILKRPGATLLPGDAVLELDLSESMTALGRAENDLKVKSNLTRQARLASERTLADLEDRLSIERLELDTARAARDGHRRLASLGLISGDELRRSELAVKQREVELAQVERERTTAVDESTLQLEGLSLEQASLDRDLAERRRLLELATTKSDRKGVLTWIVNEEGALVRRGEILARVADLSSFRVDASVSDVHAGRVRVGLPAIVRLEDLALEGRITDVNPTIDNGTVRFTVALTDSAHTRLRASLRVDVQVVTERKAQVLKVKRGTFADGLGTRQVFVLRGERAVRVPVEFGIGNVDEIEILSGLSEGDAVILSDMTAYVHLSEITVR